MPSKPHNSPVFTHSGARRPIHFTFYDIVLNLRELNRVLKLGARFALNILDADTISVASNAVLRYPLEHYRTERETIIFTMLQPFSQTAFANVASQLGFVVESSTTRKDSNLLLVIKKVAALQQ